MRTLRLAHIAAEAEGLRLRHQARRTLTRAVLAAFAIGFAVGGAIFVHIAAWSWLRLSWDAQYAALVMAGGDFVLASALALFAAHSSPGRIEQEALALRRQAITSVTDSFALPAVTLQLVREVNELLRHFRG